MILLVLILCAFMGILIPGLLPIFIVALIISLGTATALGKYDK